MKLRMLYVLVLGLSVSMFTCTKSSDPAGQDVTGAWKLIGVFLSDAKDTPCGWEVKDHKDITLVIKSGSNNASYSFSGQSVVNTYSGRFTKGIYDETTQRGTIKIEEFLNTEIGAGPELMQCETRYFDFLHAAEEYSFDDNGHLLVGRLKKPNSNPRDGGVYLIFESTN